MSSPSEIRTQNKRLAEDEGYTDPEKAAAMESDEEAVDDSSYDPRKFAVDGMIMDCFDLLLEAEDLDDFVAAFDFDRLSSTEFAGIEEYIICLGLSLMHIQPEEPCHKRIVKQLLGPLLHVVAQRDATPEDRKVQFLEEAKVGFQRNEVKGTRTPTFTYRGHEMTMHCLKVDMIITHYQLVRRPCLPSQLD